MLIGLAAKIAAGKDEVARLIESHYRFKHLSLSDEIRLEATKRGLSHSREDLTKIGNEIRATAHPSELARRTLSRVEGNTVFSSIRNLAEVEFFRKQPNFHLIAIEAPVEVRFARLQKRGRVGDGATIESLLETEKAESEGKKHEMQLQACVDAADFVITNDSTIEHLIFEIDRVMGKLGLTKPI